MMTSVRDIERAIEQLHPGDLAAFRQWFAEFDAGVWDQRFDADVTAGRLDRFGAEAVRDLHEGRCSDL